MSDFSIKTNDVKVLARNFNNISGNMQDYHNEAESILRSLENTSSLGVSLRLLSPGFQMDQNIRLSRSMGDQLEKIVQRYQQAENKNSRQDGSGGSNSGNDQEDSNWFNTIKFDISDVLKILDFPKGVEWPPSYFFNQLSITPVLILGLLGVSSGGASDNAEESDNTGGKTKSSYKKKLAKAEKDSDDVKIVYDTKTKTTKTIDPDNKKENDEFDDNKSLKTNVYIYGKDWTTREALDGTGEQEWGDKNGIHGTVEGKVLEYEYGPKAYVVPGGAVAGIGAGLTLEKVEGRAQIGDEDTNAYLEGEVVVGKVSGKVEGQLGFDDKGKFGAYAGMEAEAIAAELSAKGGFKVDGVDVGIKGSVDVGVGAHANVGYKDGKIYVDAGASCGVGGSVSLEIDVSEKVDQVINTAQSVIKTFENYKPEDWQNLARGASKLFNWIR